MSPTLIVDIQNHDLNEQLYVKPLSFEMQGEITMGKFLNYSQLLLFIQKNGEKKNLSVKHLG